MIRKSLLCLLTLPVALNSQTKDPLNLPGREPFNSSFSKGLTFKAPDSTYSLKFGFRFQNLAVFQTTSQDMSQFETRTMVRRARLKFDGFAMSPKLVYKLELGLSNSDIGNAVPQGGGASNIIYDAVVKYKFVKNTSLWFGQTKLPGNRERVVSSQALQFVDRSNVNAEFNIDRDVGFQLHNEFQIGKVVFRDIYAITSGEGRNITTGNSGGLDYTARLEVLPFGHFTKKGDYFSSDLYREKSPKLSLAATYDYNVGATREKGQLGKFLTSGTDLKTVFVDLMFKYSGFSVLAEYADKNANSPIVFDDSGERTGQFVVGSGITVQSGYLFENNWELAGRYTEVIYDESIEKNSTWMYTLGVSKYIVGHKLKVQADISLIDTEFQQVQDYMGRFQVEVAF